jgi:hypothetical protein
VELHAHMPGNQETLEAKPVPMAQSFMLNMEKRGYVIFHKESNTIGCMGACIEYSFLKLDSKFHKRSPDSKTRSQTAFRTDRIDFMWQTLSTVKCRLD